jgi:hypothetical protein
MHRPLLITAFVLLLALAAASAQRGGGGHASGGGQGGFASHGSGFSGGGHSFAGTRSGSAVAAYPSARAYASRPALSSRGFNHSGGVRLRTYGLMNRYGYGVYGYPWWYGGIYSPYIYSPYYDPYWSWDPSSSFDYEQQYETGLANEMNEQSLEKQRLREQSDQYLYAQAAPPPPPRGKERTEAVPATVLVFRDQHRQEVQNYAIVGQTLWTFAPQHTQKIPLSDLDLPATSKANDERGVDFRLPGAHEGQ